MYGTNFVIYFAAALTLWTTFLHNVDAIDMKVAREGSSCFDIDESKTVPVDLEWFMSQKTWYYPLMSRTDLYHMSVDVSGKKPEELSEDELYYDSCLTFELVGSTYVAKGFGNKKVSYSTKPIKGLEIVEFAPDKGNMKGTCYTTLTDNKTFVYGACCLSDNQMTWGVMSPMKVLPAKTKKQIYDHAESLGFKRDYFTRFMYGNCKDSGKAQQEQLKNEL